DQVAAGLEGLAMPLEATDIRPALITALMEANQGKHADALAKYRDLLDVQDTPSPDGVIVATTMAQLSLAKSLVAIGSTSEASEIYRQIIREKPLSAMGAMAATQLDKLRGKKEAIFPVTDELEKLAAGVPRWV
ncbi:MAG: hypothetical protein ACK58T_46755, partial [Phycisphaerae bacterium]